jgi:thiol:disulfide interchange protein
MKTSIRILAVLAMAHSAWADPVNWERDFDQALQKAKAGKKLVMVDIYTDWCGWCKKLDRDVYTNEQVEKKLARDFVSVKINPEKEAGNAQLARQFGTRGFPHIVFADADGKKVAEIRGYIAADAFLKQLEQLTVKPAK